MSKSDDNTNELESYGVWVKNSTGNSDNTETPADPSDELNLDDGGLDLPDFDDSDFSDMFKEEPQGADAGSLDDFGSEDDTTLSTDELANITDGFEVEQVEAPEETDDLDLGDFDIPDSTDSEPQIEAETEVESEEVSFDEIEDSASTEEQDTEAPSFEETTEEVSTEDFNFDIDEPEASTESAEEEVSIESDGDEEISLDDFMDGGFSDESVAAGNNGYEPGAEPAAASSGTEELSLDDFMDGESFESAPAEAKEAEIIEDEAPLDMDISFDDSADTVETEDNVSLDISSDDDDADFDSEESAEIETEEVSMDDFGSSFTAEETSTPSDSSENINTEDVDLSDFGIDADAEETPIVQDVEEAKKKENVVDYELSVGDENTASAPVVNEIKNDVVEDLSEETVEEAEPVAPAASENTTAVDNSLLQQIVSELSNLKDEMNKLKTNLEEIKTQENTVKPAAAAVAAGVAGVAAGAAIAAATSEADEIPEAKDEGGFFSGDDEDETIALSFDELDNIMNTAEFSDTVEAPAEEPSAEEPAVEEPVVEESVEEPAVEEPVIEETVADEPVIEEEAEEPAFEETSISEDISASFDEVTPEDAEIEDVSVNQDDTVIDESIISSEVEAEADSDEFTTEDTIIEDAISDEKDTSLDDINFEDDQEDNFDFASEEKLEEPKIDEFIPDGNDELYENEELPDEISIPKEDDLLVESTTSDFMDSVKETTDEGETATEFVADETDEVDTIDLPSELPDTIIEEPAEESEEPVIEEETEEEIQDDDIPTVDKVLGDEPVIEETIDESFDETAVDESETVEEPAVETEVEPETSSVSFAEVDNLDNTLSESNLAYLDKTEGDNASDSIANADLKQDIKSVLLYMDQLLENLPEDKIVEFAKSDEFVTYKKLFSELGLS